MNLLKNQNSNTSFSDSLFRYNRRKTRVVPVGNVLIGGDNPLRIQSMTTTKTTDTDATVQQAIRIIKAGGEIVRITAPSELDARNLKNIAAALRSKGYKTPLVADIHFRPEAALEAAEHVEKVRVNPGNYADSKLFKIKEYTDNQYNLELEHLEEKLTPLILKLKQLGKALRIGTNHGSLSDRIMNRYGDSPEGMVESALEFVRLCEKNNYREIILSMKASNPKIMIAAYRLLATRMKKESMDYPFHLGVTEAGDGEDGRIKSAIGIGSLLEDGIGDTIRVSLTEDPEFEIPVAQQLADDYDNKKSLMYFKDLPAEKLFIRDFYHYEKRKTKQVQIGPFSIEKDHPIRIVSQINHNSDPEDFIKSFEDSSLKATPPEVFQYTVQSEDDIKNLKQFRRAILLKQQNTAHIVRPTSALCLHPELWELADAVFLDTNLLTAEEKNNGHIFPLIDKISQQSKNTQKAIILESTEEESLNIIGKMISEKTPHLILSLKSLTLSKIIFQSRSIISREWVIAGKFPLMIQCPRQENEKSHTLRSSILMGTLLCDGIGDLVQLNAPLPFKKDLKLAYNILQGAGVRITKTEYVSCPSCGRTLFDLQETTNRIKLKTNHLKNVKIAIMGCIVNGPGEMADADFGYVGGGPGKINLYVGQECIEKGIPTKIADEKLIELIKQHGKWTNKNES